MHYSENTAAATHALPNDLSVSQDGPVTLLRLSRPAKRNALDRNMIAGIEAFFRSPPDCTRAVLLMESLMAAITGANDEARTRLRNFLEKRAPKILHRAPMPEAIIPGDRSGR